MNFEPEMFVIPAGEFLMGCETGAANEHPAHRVWLDGEEIETGCELKGLPLRRTYG